MAIKLHNTLTGTTEEFHPIGDGKVKMFVCGPTVYDYSHLGHGKTYTQFDIVARTLRYLGFDLTYVVNITDIEDKIITRAKERGVDSSALAREFEKTYLEDMRALNITSVDKYARATDYIPEIISQVERLMENGRAYKISDGYYFDTKKFADYGKLSGRDSLKPGDAVSRIDENPEKKNQADFCLWKFKKEGEPSWPASIGEGRPGWHIEDTAITEKEFGPQYDIHGGAVDLIFPHHEAEIAQMESISGRKPLVRYWLHTGFLNIDSQKMSKSKNNFHTIRDAINSGFSPLALRYLFLLSHYRTPVNFTWEALTAAQNAYRKLKDLGFKIQDLGIINEEYRKQFKNALEDDLNTPEALAIVWNLVKDESISPADKRATLLEFDKVLGLNLGKNEFLDVPADIVELGEKRQKAKDNKDFTEADRIRNEIEAKGFEIRDTEGTFLIMKK